MNKKTEKKDILCNSCQHHFTIANCDCCGKCGPNWGVENGQFECTDYKKKKEINDEKKDM